MFLQYSAFLPKLKLYAIFFYVNTLNRCPFRPISGTSDRCIPPSVHPVQFKHYFPFFMFLGISSVEMNPRIYLNPFPVYLENICVPAICTLIFETNTISRALTVHFNVFPAFTCIIRI